MKLSAAFLNFMSAILIYCLFGTTSFSQSNISTERTLRLPGEKKGVIKQDNNLTSESVVDFGNSLSTASDFLLSVQSTSNFGWDWTISPPFVPATATYNTLYGVTALGLYYAYLKSNNIIYKNALTNICNFIITNPNVKDITAVKLLLLYQELPGVTADIYKNAAKVKYDTRIAEHGPSATLFAQWLREYRGVTQGYKNGIIAWDLGAHALVAKMLYENFGGTYNQDAMDFAEVLFQDSYNNSPGYFKPLDSQNRGWDPGYGNTNYWWYTLGISGLVDAFVSSGTHTFEISGLVTILNDCKFTSGTVRGAYSNCYGAHVEPTFTDDDWQTTAYVVLSLSNYEQSIYQNEINSACYYLATTQHPAYHAWIYSDGTTYPEVDGECASALYFGSKPLTEFVDASYTSGSCDGHFWGYDAFSSIQDAIDAAATGAVVYVAAGTYNESVNLNKVLTLNGAGNGTDGTIITYPTGIALSLSAGADATHRVIINNLRLSTSTTGLVASSYNSINNVTSISNTNYGITLNNLTDLIITNSKFNFNGSSGLKISSTTSADHITISNSEFNGNSYGWYGDANITIEPMFNYINVTSTTFNNNLIKGIYLERLSESTFNNITVNNSGTGGIDLNLKWRLDYSNITISNSTILNCGLGDPNGAGIIIKARSDGATYGANPAALDHVTLANLIVTGCGNGLYSSGIRIGEANNSLTGTNVSPTNVSITNCQFSNNSPFALSNVLNNITITAENNWWDAIDENVIQTRINNFAHVDYDPWLGKGFPKGIITYPTGNTTVYTNKPTLSWYLIGTPTPLSYTVLLRKDGHSYGESFPNALSINAGSNITVIVPDSYELSPGQKYYFTVRSNFIGGIVYSLSTEESFTVNGSAGNIPVKPILAYPVSDLTVYSSTPTLCWYLGASTIGLSYQVDICRSDSSFDGIPTQSNISGLSYITYSLSTGYSYNWRVRSYAGGIYSDWSDVGHFHVFGSGGGGTTVLPLASYPIGGITVYTVAPTIYWYLQTIVSGVTFKVHYGTVSGGPYTLETSASTNMKATLSGLLTGTNYYYKIEAISGSVSTFSDEESFLIAGGSGTPAVPNPSWPIGGATVYTTSQTLYWWMTTPFGIASYTTLISTEPDMSGAVLHLTTSPNVALSGLTPGETYYWQVKSFDGTNYSPLSAIEHFVVYSADLPFRPIVGGPSGNMIIGSLSPILSWYLPANVTGQSYDLEYSKNADFSSSIKVSNITQMNNTITGLNSGSLYYWRVRSLKDGYYSRYSFKGEFTPFDGVTSIDEKDIIPEKFTVDQNFPNPFNPSTTIRFGIPEDGMVSLKIYNMLGQEVKSLISEEKKAGTYRILWNGDNNSGQRVSSGTYIFRVIAGENIQTMKMILLK